MWVCNKLFISTDFIFKAIVRHQIKLTDEEIVSAIVNCDVSKLSIQQLDAVLKYAPTPEEIVVFTEYKGDKNLLGSAETFLSKIAEIPNLNLKLESMIFIKDFYLKLNEISPVRYVIYIYIYSYSTSCYSVKLVQRFPHQRDCTICFTSF
jgi:hypothetical protein